MLIKANRFDPVTVHSVQDKPTSMNHSRVDWQRLRFDTVEDCHRNMSQLFVLWWWYYCCLDAKGFTGTTIGSCQLQLIGDYSSSSAGGGNGYILWDTMQSTVISTTTESIKESRGGGGLVQLWLNCFVAQQQTNWNTKWLMNNNGQGLPCTLALRNRRRSTLNLGPCTLGCGYEWCNKVRNRAGNHKGE